MMETNELMETAKELEERIKFFQEKADEIVEQRQPIYREYVKLGLELKRMDRELNMAESGIRFNTRKLKTLDAKN